ncbi:MAG: hypothetical protein NT067_04650 [Candidatus Diapherotrites archaeon]|nr:hypothetical protein [Candidatus Diapherotrites archaeon]
MPIREIKPKKVPARCSETRGSLLRKPIPKWGSRSVRQKAKRLAWQNALEADKPGANEERLRQARLRKTREQAVGLVLTKIGLFDPGKRAAVHWLYSRAIGFNFKPGKSKSKVGRAEALDALKQILGEDTGAFRSQYSKMFRRLTRIQEKLDPALDDTRPIYRRAGRKKVK